MVGAPDCFERHPLPKTPHDLTSHPGINQRMPTSGGLYVWDFERRGRKANVRVDGPLIFNTPPPQVDAALAGLGIALLPEGRSIRIGANAPRQPQCRPAPVSRAIGIEKQMTAA